MLSPLTALAAALLAPSPAWGPSAPVALPQETLGHRFDPAIRPGDIQAHVDHLASDTLEGRGARTEEARVAARYIAESFQSYGLEPLERPPGNPTPAEGVDAGSYFLPIDEERTAPNVVGVLPGKGAGYVIVSAHYDHLPPRKSGEDRIFNGADDNASGVAAVLELAQAFAARKKKSTASILFVAFTAEELGLRGSRHFVRHPPVPLEEILGVVNLDMISRGRKNLIFCEGGDCEPMRRAADKANRKIGLEIRYDRHPRWRYQSDHAPFMQEGIPTLYFGVEDHEDYHQVGDHADKILPDLASRVAELTFLILLDRAEAALSAPHAETGARGSSRKKD